MRYSGRIEIRDDRQVHEHFCQEHPDKITGHRTEWFDRPYPDTQYKDLKEWKE